MKSLFEKQYPNIDRWVSEHEGWIELGYDSDSPLTSFIRALDCGGMLWEGEDHYNSIDEALQDAEQAIGKIFQDIYGELRID